MTKPQNDELENSGQISILGMVVSSVVHEINNPLAVATANIDLLQRDLFQEPGSAAGIDDARERIRDILAALGEAQDIVRDLAVLAGTGGGGPELVETTPTLEAVVRLVLGSLRTSARVAMDVEMMPPIVGTRQKLAQALLSMFMHVASTLPEARASQNKIRVRTDLDGDRIVIEVMRTNTEAVTQTSPTDSHLELCRRHVADLGGELDIEAFDPSACRYRMILPAARKEAPAKGLRPKLAVAAERVRVLVVDDEALFAKAMERSLSDHCDVSCVSSAGEAYRYLMDGGQVDIILCDVSMPGMSGMDLYRVLSRRAPEQAGRMIFVTGGASSTQARRFLETVPNPTLEKPFETSALLALIAERV